MSFEVGRSRWGFGVLGGVFVLSGMYKLDNMELSHRTVSHRYQSW